MFNNPTQQKHPETNSLPKSPLLRPVSPAGTNCNSGIACVASAALCNQTAAAVSAAAPGFLLSSEKGQPQALQRRWTDRSLGNRSK